MVKIIGITGGSASGKTTFAKKLIRHIGDDNCTYLAHDRYYKEGLLPETSNYDHPQNIDSELFFNQLTSLCNHSKINAPIYDYTVHKRIGSNTIFPSDIIILDGILLLYDERIRSLITTSIFVTAPEQLRYTRRLKRDIDERGRTKESVDHQFFNQVQPMHQKFIEPQKKFCDIIVDGEQLKNEDDIIAAILNSL